MKTLTCEMCGSTDLLKSDGVFVCQSCGTKYTVEEAKKMMLDGPTDVASTVKVDQTKNVSNYLNLAQNALNSVNGSEAYQFANKALEIQPENAEAWFIKMKAVGLTAILKDLKVNEVVTCGNNVIKYNTEMEIEVYKYYLTKMLGDLKFCMKQMLDTENIRRLYEANERLDPNSSSVKTSNADKISSIIISQMNLVIYLRRVIPNDIVSSNDSIAKLVAEVAKQFIYFAESVNTRYGTYNMCMTDNSITSYRNFLAEIKQGLPDDLMQETKLEDISKPIPQETSNSTSASNDGCYVATAVYGSYDCPQVWTLRRFRDNTLDATWYGRTFIKTYYATSPTLVKWFGDTDWFKNMCRKPLDKLVNKLRSEGIEDTPYQDKRF